MVFPHTADLMLSLCTKAEGADLRRTLSEARPSVFGTCTPYHAKGARPVLPKRSQGPALLFRSGCQRLGPLRQAPSILSFSHDPGSVLAFVQRPQFCQRYAVVDDDCSIPDLEPRGTLDAGELLVFVDIRHVVRDWRVTIENGRTNRDLFRRAVKWVVS
jgi:hypothetical protein